MAKDKKVRFKISLVTKDYKKGLKQVVKGSRGFVNKLKAIFKPVKNVIFGPISAGVIGLSRLFGSIGSAIRQAGQDFIEFESAIADINSLIAGKGGLTDATKKFLREQAKLYGTSALENAKAYYDIVSAGITDQVEAMKVLNTANKIAITGNVAVSQSVGALLSVMKSYGEETITAAEAGDILQTVVNKGQTTWAAMSQYISVVAGDAKAAGVSVKELAAMFSILTEKGLDTARATTSIRGILNVLSKGPGPEAKKVMDQLGVSFDLQTVRAKGFAQTLADLLQKVEGNADALGKIFPEMEARTGAAQMSFKRWSELTKEFANTAGALNDAMIDKLSTIEAKMKRIDAIITDSGMTKEFAELNLELKRTKMHFATELMPLVSKFVGFLSKAGLGLKMTVLDITDKLTGSNKLKAMMGRMSKRDKAVDDPNYKTQDQILAEKEKKEKEKLAQIQQKMVQQSQAIKDAYTNIRDLTKESIDKIAEGVERIRKKTLDAIQKIKDAFLSGTSFGGLAEKTNLLRDDKGTQYAYGEIRELISGGVSGQGMAQIARVAKEITGPELKGLIDFMEELKYLGQKIKPGDLKGLLELVRAGGDLDDIKEEMGIAVTARKKAGMAEEQAFKEEAERKVILAAENQIKAADKNIKTADLMKQVATEMKKAVEEHKKVVKTPVTIKMKGELAKYVEQSFENSKRTGTAGPGITRVG